MHVQIGDPNLDFQPLLIEETGETAGVEVRNHDEDGQVQEDELSADEAPNDGSTSEEISRTEPTVQQNRGLRRSRVEEEEDDSEGGLELPYLKKWRTVEVPSESEDEWTPTYPPRLPGGRWPDEGPSDHRAEVWEEIWDDQLEEEFEKEKKKARDSGVMGGDLGRLEGEARDETEEEEEVYGTDYIEWEAKEVIDLVSTSDDSG